MTSSPSPQLQEPTLSFRQRLLDLAAEHEELQRENERLQASVSSLWSVMDSSARTGGVETAKVAVQVQTELVGTCGWPDTEATGPGKLAGARPCAERSKERAVQMEVHVEPFPAHSAEGRQKNLTDSKRPSEEVSASQPKRVCHNAPCGTKPKVSVGPSDEPPEQISDASALLATQLYSDDAEDIPATQYYSETHALLKAWSSDMGEPAATQYYEEVPCTQLYNICEETGAILSEDAEVNGSGNLKTFKNNAQTKGNAALNSASSSTAFPHPLVAISRAMQWSSGPRRCKKRVEVIGG